MYEVYVTETFEKELAKFDKDYQARLEKIYLQLRVNPYVGDQLQYKNLREKRVKEKRIYYLVYNENKIVLMVAISGKKDQQETINHIIRNFEKYRELALKIKD